MIDLEQVPVPRLEQEDPHPSSWCQGASLSTCRAKSVMAL
jgi:hypothetical protein